MDIRLMFCTLALSQPDTAFTFAANPRNLLILGRSEKCKKQIPGKGSIKLRFFLSFWKLLATECQLHHHLLFVCHLPLFFTIMGMQKLHYTSYHLTLHIKFGQINRDGPSRHEQYWNSQCQCHFCFMMIDNLITVNVFAVQRQTMRWSLKILELV